MSAAAERDPLDILAQLVGAARNADDVATKAMYLAAGRELLTRATARIDVLRVNLGAVEAETARLSKGASS